MKELIILLCILLLFILILAYFLKINEEDYNYQADYNNAIQNGRIVSGTVYDSRPPEEENTGLGWIL
jgi:hypothetical protein